jgi:hypothetical protein
MKTFSVALAVAVLAFIGCETKAEKQAKVDCAVFGKKLSTCTERLLFAFEPQEYENQRKMGVHPITTTGHQDRLEQITGQCKAMRGRIAGAKMINDYLTKSTCDKFATFIVATFRGYGTTSTEQ